MRTHGYWNHIYYTRRTFFLKNSGTVNEKLLFHGTRNTNPKLIYCSEVGFDVRFSSKGRWGHAIYFSENASYGDKYAHITPSGDKQLIMANVLTGCSYSSIPDSTLKLAPVITKDFEANGLFFSELLYDSVNALSKGSQPYMIYDNSKSIPCYHLLHKLDF